MLPLLIGGGILVVLIIIIWVIYNRMVQAQNVVDEAFSNIDIQLKKRFELIPNLIEAVKGYNAHEAEVLADIVEKRSGIGATISETAAYDKSITGALKNFRVHVEDYPDLQANTQFLKLMDALSTVENELSMARRYYNGTVRDMNNTLQVFPNVAFAGMFGFTKKEFYEIDADEKQAPVVDVTGN